MQSARCCCGSSKASDTGSSPSARPWAAGGGTLRGRRGNGIGLESRGDTWGLQLSHRAVLGTDWSGWAGFSLQKAESSRIPSLVGSMAQTLQAAYLPAISSMKKVPSATWDAAGGLLQLTPNKAASIAREKVGALGGTLRSALGILSHYVPVSLSCTQRALCLHCRREENCMRGLGPMFPPIWLKPLMAWDLPLLPPQMGTLPCWASFLECEQPSSG